MNPLIILYSLIGPFLLWPLELILPYPYIIEEIFKLFVVKNTTGDSKYYFLAGVIFALTETIFYSININLLGTGELFIKRFIFTSLLHGTTYLLIFKFSKLKNGIIFGLLTAILIHYLYNNIDKVLISY